MSAYFPTCLISPPMLRERPLLFLVLVAILASYFIYVGVWFEEILPTGRDLWDRHLKPSRWFRSTP
jgi:hypothetical protein